MSSKSNLRVLLADDEHALARGVQRVLMRIGHSNVTTVANGKAAFQELKKGSFDAAIIDLDFGDNDIDGLSVLLSVKRYNERNPENPIKTQIIVMSGSVDGQGLEEKLLDAGASMVLHKPLHAISIAAALDMIAETHEFSPAVNTSVGQLHLEPMTEPIR